jgi:hypothetical protein
MSRNENVNDAPKGIEAALGALVPRSDRLDRDRLMFLAGQAAVEAQAERVSRATAAGGPRRWLWPAAFSTASAAAVVLAALLVLRPERIVVEYVPQPPANDARPEAPLPSPDGRGAERDAGQSALAVAPLVESPALAETGPLLRLRTAQRELASADSAQWLDQVLGPSTTARAGSTDRDAPCDPEAYTQRTLREELLLKGRGRDSSPAPRPWSLNSL